MITASSRSGDLVEGWRHRSFRPSLGQMGQPCGRTVRLLFLQTARIPLRAAMLLRAALKNTISWLHPGVIQGAFEHGIQHPDIRSSIAAPTRFRPPV